MYTSTCRRTRSLRGCNIGWSFSISIHRRRHDYTERSFEVRLTMTDVPLLDESVNRSLPIKRQAQQVTQSSCLLVLYKWRCRRCRRWRQSGGASLPLRPPHLQLAAVQEYKQLCSLPFPRAIQQSSRTDKGPAPPSGNLSVLVLKIES